MLTRLGEMGRINGRRMSLLQQTLRRRVKAICTPSNGITSLTADQIVYHLRSTYPDYHRTKHQTLIRFVEEALQSTRKHLRPDELPNVSRKRRKNTGEGELTSCDSASETDVTPSELTFDLTKTMLRNSYMEKNVVELDGEVDTKLKLQRKQVNYNGSDVEVKEEEEEKEKEKDVIMFRDLGGIGKVKKILEPFLLAMKQAKVTRKLEKSQISGILLHGPPGCGKTTLVRAIANETGASFYQISAAELVSGISGESEENIRDLFSRAHRTAPSIVFIDEIDAIASKREDSLHGMEKRIVTQLCSCMDRQPSNGNYALVIAATNLPHAIDPALRRPGRFEHEIVIDRPDQSSREEILSVLARQVPIEGPIDLKKLAKATPGFVAADLESVINHSGYLAAKRIVFARFTTTEPPEDWYNEPWSQEEVDKAAIRMCDLEGAVKLVQPSIKREGFSDIPNVKWDDIGGLDFLRREFDDHIVRPIKYPEDYERFGMNLSTGFLLYGPPGCGKTLIAKAVANAAGASFRHIKGPELLSKYVGESEREVRKMFNDARTCAPCILFFDEVDALTSKRSEEGGKVINQIINQLLVELDGAGKRTGVFLIGATNRPEVVDPALLRPGRFGQRIYVPLPSPDERVLILKALARKHPVDASTDLNAIGRLEACENMSGADLAELMVKAAMAALRERTTTDITCDTIKPCHFDVALRKVSPSVSVEQRQYYQHLSETFK